VIYSICTYLLLIGLLGIVAQFLLGVSHGGHMGHAVGHGHTGHTGHEAGHTGHVPAHGSTSKTSVGGSGRFIGFMLTLLSPIMIFSVCFGAGAAGLLVKHLHLPVYEVAEAAAISGIGLYAAIVRPLWQFLFRFASAPSEGLEGAIGSEAQALSGFDSSGRGLVKLTIDGQIASNVLAYLDDSDRNIAQDIHPGDFLTVTSVDPHNNTCRVVRL